MQGGYDKMTSYGPLKRWYRHTIVIGLSIAKAGVCIMQYHGDRSQDY